MSINCKFPLDHHHYHLFYSFSTSTAIKGPINKD